MTSRPRNKLLQQTFFFFLKGNVCYLESYLKYTYSKSRAHGLASSFSQGVHDCPLGQPTGWVYASGKGLKVSGPWQCSTVGDLNLRAAWVGSCLLQAPRVGDHAVGPVARDPAISSTYHFPAFMGGRTCNIYEGWLTQRHTSIAVGEQVPSLLPVPESVEETQSTPTAQSSHAFSNRGTCPPVLKFRT